MSVGLENGIVKTVDQNLGVVRTAIYPDEGNVENEQLNGHPLLEDSKPVDAAPQKDDIKEEMATSNTNGRLMCKILLCE